MTLLCQLGCLGPAIGQRSRENQCEVSDPGFDRSIPSGTYVGSPCGTQSGAPAHTIRSPGICLYATASVHSIICTDLSAGLTRVTPPIEPTLNICLPKLECAPDDEGQGWERPPVWGNTTEVTDDTITLPEGRPIYALIVSGYF